MPALWATDQQLLADVTRFLGMNDTGDMADRWLGICARVLPLAQAELTGILAGKGYSPAQVTGWDWKREYLLELATYLVVCRGQPDKAKEAEPLDRRKELRESLTILIGGVPVGPPSPASTDVGGISYGVTTTARDELIAEARSRGWFS